MLDFNPNFYDISNAKTLSQEDIGSFKLAEDHGDSDHKVLFYEVKKKLYKDDQLKNLEEYKVNCMKLMYYQPEKPKQYFLDIIHIEDTPDVLQIFYNYHNLNSLRSHLDKYPNKRLPQNKALPLIYQIIKAIELLEFLSISHRGIIPNNIYLDENDNIKIGIPLYFPLKVGIFIDIEFFCYDSPNVIENASPNVKDNVWQFGVLFHEILFGFGAEITTNGLKLIPTPENISNSAKELIKACIIKNQQKRITGMDLQKTPIFSIISPPSDQKYSEKDENGFPLCYFDKVNLKIKSEESSNFLLIVDYILCFKTFNYRFGSDKKFVPKLDLEYGYLGYLNGDIVEVKLKNVDGKVRAKNASKVLKCKRKDKNR